MGTVIKTVDHNPWSIYCLYFTVSSTGTSKRTKQEATLAGLLLQTLPGCDQRRRDVTGFSINRRHSVRDVEVSGKFLSSRSSGVAAGDGGRGARAGGVPLRGPVSRAAEEASRMFHREQ